MMKQLPTESKKFDLKNWCIENKAYLLLIILIYQVVLSYLSQAYWLFISSMTKKLAGVPL